MEKEKDLMEKIVSLCKRRGFVFAGSEIYGGMAGTWDYGPYGAELSNNIKDLWWKKFISDREDMYGIDASIIMNPKAWEASGHVSGFSDPLIECNVCKNRFRADHLVIDKNAFRDFISSFVKWLKERSDSTDDSLKILEGKLDEFKGLNDYFGGNIPHHVVEEFKNLFLDLKDKVIKEHKIDKFLLKQIILSKKYVGVLTQQFFNKNITCSNCKENNWGILKQFNMMFKTNVGAMEDASSVAYLRPETAGGMFVNFKNILDSMHPKLPFGMGQIGKAFRNEIAPRDFIFRSREFKQMEIEYFVDPRDEKKVMEIFDGWHDEQINFLKELGLNEGKLHKIEVPESDRAHYSKRSIDIEFDFPFGQKELLGLAYRTDFDLKNHSSYSGTDLVYFDEQTKERITPHCIEPTFGLERLFLAVLSNAYFEEEKDGEIRVVLKISPKLAPVKCAVFPLLKNKENLVEKAKEIYKELKKEFGAVEFDDNGNIGKRYRRQDEIGTPFCVTVDFDTIEKDGTVTLRNRDTGEQERKTIEEIKEIIRDSLK